eukprot:CAMPEP_0197624378 /NCGR_PEP_ID=MMETSP1338-20131121/4039_1 /TAXON_ID=43686 ORGANISM="Pelagodinium beii, Strain RCC1491" /NCGR_SAMPLE_ID=MMETSP1338 /ASSEMBLY_ACC=CAM_ASM_000754 /LENGTH=300 /DNA_ID=CAMNT_0043194507 /DNA_START=95 /DNA_END=997 /DNA_ORIENTATION=-
MDKTQLDAKVRSTIGWYNKQGKLAKPIQFSEVAQFLVHLEPKSALAIVCGLEGKEEQITDPTAWICKAAKKYAQQRMEDGSFDMGGGGSWGGGGGSWSGGGGGGWGGNSWGGGGGGGWGGKQALDASVRGAIGQYNKHPGLQAPIQFDTVAPLLAVLSPAAAMSILASMEPKISMIKDPTAWITAAATRAMTSGGDFPQMPMQMQMPQQSWGGGGGGGSWGGGGGGYQDNGTPSVGKLIAQFNRSGQLQQSIQYDEVAPLLAQLEPSLAAMIVKSIEGKETQVTNPTAWLANAARKYGAQ